MLVASFVQIQCFAPACPTGAASRIHLRPDQWSRISACSQQIVRWREPRCRRRALEMGGDKPSESSFSEAEFKGLMQRVAATRSKIAELPLVVLDAMLPRQRLTFGTTDLGFRTMVQTVQRNNEAERDRTGACTTVLIGFVGASCISI